MGHAVYNSQNRQIPKKIYNNLQCIDEGTDNRHDNTKNAIPATLISKKLFGLNIFRAKHL